MTSDGANSYTWDRANRLLSRGGYSYAYNGDGQRISQSLSSTVTQYLLDIQPGLEVVLRETTGSDVESFVYDPRGLLHSQQKASGQWRWMAEDGLGSIRSVVNANAVVVASSNYAPYGSPFDVVGAGETPFGYTGEYTDPTGNVYLRARYYNPSMGTFTALDPFEGYVDLPMSINGYGYVHGNPINLTDPSGMFAQFLVGALGGLALGTIMGYAQGTLLYQMSISGACGCDKQIEASQIGQSEFVRNATLVGAAMGTVMGLAATIPGGGLLLSVMNLYEKVEIATKLVGIVNDIRDNGQIDDWCPVAELIFDFFTERVTNKLADIAPKRKINRDVDASAPRQRRNQQDIPNQRRRSCPNSFSADTVVVTQDGRKAIEDIEVGDMVLGYSEQTESVSLMHVTATYREYHEATLDVTIDGEVVHTTDEHPFFVDKDGEGEWVKAKDLQVGDVIFNTMSKDGFVEAVEIVNAPQTMYNLSVEIVVSYFVGEGQWLTHNNDNFLFPDMPEPIRPEGVFSDDFYSVLFEVMLRPTVDYPVHIEAGDKTHEGQLRRQHNKYANQQFRQVIAELQLHDDPTFQRFKKHFATVVSHRNLTEPPIGWTWHHHPDKVGLMQLVPESQHTHRPVRSNMHVQPGNRGGFTRWTNSNSPHYLGDDIVLPDCP